MVRDGNQFVLSLTIETPPMRVARALRSQNCELLSESAAVLVALASGSSEDEADAGRAQTPTDASVETESAGLQEKPQRTTSSLPELTSSPSPTEGVPRPPTPRTGSRSTPDASASPYAAQGPFARPESVPSDSRVRVPSTRREAEHDLHAREAARLSHPPWATRVSVGAGMFANGLPGPRPDLFGEVALEVRAISASLRLGHLFGGSRGLPANARARYFSDYLALSGCRRWGTPRVVAGPCVSVLGSRSRAASEGLVDAQNRNAFWAQVGLGATLRFRLSKRVELGLETELLLPISARPQFNVVNAGALEQGSVVSGYSHIDLGIRFE